MATVAPKSYLHDKTILLFASVNIFLAFLAVLIILLRILSVSSPSYFIGVRIYQGIVSYTPGHLSEFFAFIIFALAMAAFHIFLSIRTYHIRRQLAVAILSMGVMLLVTMIIVSNGLLVLR